MKRQLVSLCIATLLSLATAAQAYAGSKVVSLSVQGMTSPTCPTLLKSAVRKIKGVKSVDASLDTHSATIEYDEKVTSLENIQDTIESHVGFSTRLK